MSLVSGPTYYYDVTTLSVGNTTLGAIKSVSIKNNPSYIRLKNNGKYDGSVGFAQVDAQNTLEIVTQDGTAFGLATVLTGVTITFTADAVLTGGVYTAGANKTVTATLAVLMPTTTNHPQKSEADITLPFEILSGGTITYT